MTTDPRVKNLRDAQRRLRSALIANADRLDRPFTDDPDKNPWDTFVRPAMRGLEAAVDAITAMAAAPAAVPPTDRAGLRKLIAGALSEARRPGLGGMTEADAVAYMADAVLALLFGPIPADTDTATWTAIRAIQLMNEAGKQRDASAEPHRLALSDALGLGTGAPWDAIRERAAELVAANRAAILTEAADEAERVAESLRAHHEFERSTGALDVMTELRQLAAGTPQPETQATAEPWLTDSARIGRTLIWSWSDIGKGAFREGYRAAQAEARALLGGERSTDQQQPAVTLPGKEA